MSGWTRAISFVGLSQSCYRLQIFVWQRLSQKLSHQNRKSFLPCFLDPSHGEAISTTRRYRRNSRVWRNTTFCAIVCCEWLWLERFCIFKDLFNALCLDNCVRYRCNRPCLYLTEEHSIRWKFCLVNQKPFHLICSASKNQSVRTHRRRNQYSKIKEN